MKRFIYIALMLLTVMACEEDTSHLPPVEVRVVEAIDELRDELTEPANGWKLNYRPVPGSGTFYMILNFSKDGTVTIYSDLAADTGAYYQQNIPYRIDASQGIELIFETYGAFHYLFELDQASFGAEFEWMYVEEDNGDLYFKSKSDLISPTIIVLAQATAADKDAFSREIAENFQAYDGQSPRLFGGADPTQQLYLSELNYSVFWSVDLQKRSAYFDIAGDGATVAEVLAGNYATLGVATGFTFMNGQLIFDNAVELRTAAGSVTLSAITLGTFSQIGDPLCVGGKATPHYTVTMGNYSGTLTKNLFNSSGLGFDPQPSSFYAVNIPFVLDDSLRSLSETGSIAELLPNASAFVMTYGLESDSIPENSVGFIVEASDGSGELYLREANITALGNGFQIELQDSYYFGATPTAAEEAALQSITDEVFEGGTVYAYELPIQGLTAFLFYNPCNSYEFLLVR